MIASSSIIGLIGIAIAYLIAIPLGSYMALFKNSWFDSISTAALTFMMSLPTIALVYIVRLAVHSLDFQTHSQYLEHRTGVHMYCRL